MSVASKTVESFGHFYELSPGARMKGLVQLGQEVTVQTLDSSGGQIRVGVDYDQLDPSKFFPVVGPIEISGVKRGDVVGISILGMQMDSLAHTWTRPGLGLVQQDRFAVMSIDTETLEIRSQGRGGTPIARANAKPHVGALGLLTDSVQPARTLGHYGGNIDFNEIGPGSTVWLTAAVDGGGFFIGDIHATIGDGEVCGTGAETGARVSLEFHRLEGRGDILPTVEDSEGRYWVIGVGDSIEEALREATSYCVARLSQIKNIDEDEAYLTAGLLLNVRVCQVVNPRMSVAVSLDGGLDSVLRVTNDE